MTIAQPTKNYGTPIPKAEAGESYKSEPVVTKLATEEIEKYLAAKYPSITRTTNLPMGEFKLTKEQYTTMRKNGDSRLDIARRFKVHYNRLKAKCAEWGLEPIEHEIEVLDLDRTAGNGRKKHTTDTELKEMVGKDRVQEVKDEIKKTVRSLVDEKMNGFAAMHKELQKKNVMLQQQVEGLTAKAEPPAINMMDRIASGKQAVKSLSAPIEVRFPFITGDSVSEYGMQMQRAYKQFGQRVDITEADPTMVLTEALNLMQGIMSWTFNQFKKDLDEKEAMMKFREFMEQINEAHVQEVIKKAREQGWKVNGKWKI